jgi:mannose-6-phosphate isomerase-like protein (cupin superfamily)
LLIICTIAPGFSQETKSLDSEQEKDVYAIYSLMLANPQTSHGPDNNERYLIAATTTPGYPLQPCVRPPKERDREFQEVLIDYERRKATPRELNPSFSIRKPYILLRANEVSEFMKERSLGNAGTNTQFRGVTDLFRLSDVYFNPRRTLALTAISTWCGSLCALSQWKVFERLDTGKWEERQWVSCSAIARNSVPRLRATLSSMPDLIAAPHLIPVPGNKIIEEYVGRVNNREAQVSIARMRSPAGWSEPGQRPDFDEFTVVLNGALHVEHSKGVLEVRAGQAVVARKGEWIRYSTPQGAEYVAICVPAFTPDTVHRDA